MTKILDQYSEFDLTPEYDAGSNTIKIKSSIANVKSGVSIQPNENGLAGITFYNSDSLTNYGWSNISILPETPDTLLISSRSVGSGVKPSKLKTLIPLILSGAPTVDLGAATKKYVDDALDVILGSSGVTSVNTRQGAVVLTSSDVGLGNVTNESKATMFTNPTFTGTTSTSNISVTGNITTTGELRGPATFVIDPSAIGDNTGTVVIKGNLQVDGTTTTINSTTVSTADKNITLADGAINSAAADGAGITIAGANASITYSNSIDSFNFSKPINSTGNVSFSTTSSRITFDSSGTGFTRLGFKSSVAGMTVPAIIANATAAAPSNAGINLYAQDDATNGQFGQLLILGSTSASTSEVRLGAGSYGTGVAPFMTFYTGGSERLRIDTDGRFLIKNSTINVDILGNQNGLSIQSSSSTGQHAIIAGGNTSTNYLTFYTSNSTTPQERVRIDHTGNVGIGVTDFSTSGANAKFAVAAGAINLDDGNALAWGGGTGRSSITGSKAAGTITYAVAATGSTKAHIFNIGGTEAMRVDANGNLGIGISPGTYGARLTVQHNSAADQVMTLRNVSATGLSAVRLEDEGTGFVGHIGYDNDNNCLIVGGNGGIPIRFNTSNFNITSSGDVIVGTTTSANSVLEIGNTANKGTGYFRNTSTTITSDQLQVYTINKSAASDFYLFRAYTSGPTVQFAVRGDGEGYFAGNVGVGGVTPNTSWSTAVNVLQLNSQVALVARDGGDGLYLVNNAYFSGDPGFQTINNSVYTAGAASGATAYHQSMGVHKWYVAPNGAAGNPITWITGMTLNSQGNLSVGTTDAPGYRALFESSATSGNAAFAVVARGADAGKSTLSLIGYFAPTGCPTIYSSYDAGSTYLPIAFATGGSEKMRLGVDGNLNVGTGSSSGRVCASNMTAAEVGANSSAFMVRGTQVVNDDASITFTIANASMVMIAENYAGAGGMVFASYASGTVVEIADPSNIIATSDTDGFICVYKNATSSTLTVKNRLGSSKGITVGIYSVSD